jgi:uncharacterized protein (DUF342 family)
LKNNIKDTNYYIIDFEAESTEKISSLSAQVVAQEARINDYRKQLMTLEKTRADNKMAHNEKVISINNKYKDTKLMLISQIKIISNCVFIFLYNFFIKFALSYMTFHCTIDLSNVLKD